MLRSRIQERDFLPETPANWPAHCATREGRWASVGVLRHRRRQTVQPVRGPQARLPQCATPLLWSTIARSEPAHLTAVEFVALGSVGLAVLAARWVGSEVSCGCYPPRLARVLLLLLLCFSFLPRLARVLLLFPLLCFSFLPRLACPLVQHGGAAAVAAALLLLRRNTAAASCGGGAGSIVPAAPAGQRGDALPALQARAKLAVGLQAAGVAIQCGALVAPRGQEQAGAAAALRLAGDLWVVSGGWGAREGT